MDADRFVVDVLGEAGLATDEMREADALLEQMSDRLANDAQVLAVGVAVVFDDGSCGTAFSGIPRHALALVGALEYLQGRCLTALDPYPEDD